MPYARKRGCKCDKKKKCSCGATWSFTANCGKDPVTGERIQIPGSGYKTKAEALAAAKEIEIQYKNGTYVRENKISFESYSKEWLKMYRSTGEVKLGTVDVREAAIGRFLKYFKAISITDITKKMYQDMLYDLRDNTRNLHKKPFAYQTIVGTHSVGKMMFDKAVELGYIKGNPTEYAVVPKPLKDFEVMEDDEEIPKFLEKEQLSLFLKTVKEHDKDKDYAVFMTLAYTGMRIGELAILCEDDINFKEGYIRINKTVYNGKCKASEFKLQRPKTRKSKRIIEIDETLVNILREHISWQKEVKMSMRNVYYDKHNFVFANTTRNPGYPEHRNYYVRHMRRYLKLARLNEDLSPHSLRHTHTSLLAEAGVSLEAIMERLGHESDATTKKIYLHVTKSVRKEAAQKFSQLMSGL